MECPLDQALQGTLAILTKAGRRHLRGWWCHRSGLRGRGFGAAYEEGIRIAVRAFGADGALSKTIRLPSGELPGTVLRDLPTMEQFTHRWDLARATGRPADLDPGSAAGLLSHARCAVADAFRGLDGQAVSGSAREVPTGAGPAGQFAAFLGRMV